MNTAHLFADPNLLRLERVQSEPDRITLIMKTAPRPALCPRCHSPSAHLHSRYVRRLADLPWLGIAVRLEIQARRLYCRYSVLAAARRRGEIGAAEKSRRGELAGCIMRATGGILRRHHRLGGEMKQALLLACILFNFGFTDVSQTKATFSSYHGGKRYDFEVTAEQLTNCPAWLEGQDNPPLPARRAIEIATNYLSKLFLDAEKWEMSGFSVIPVGEKWVYLVHFIEPPAENVSEHLTTQFQIVVLMNGEVGRVKVSPWKLS